MSISFADQPGSTHWPTRVHPADHPLITTSRSEATQKVLLRKLPSMRALQIVALVLCLSVTAVAVALFARMISRFIATFTMGQVDHARTNEPATRTTTLVREIVGHTRMARKPVVAVAHWFVMVSFGLLFFTLLTAYGQLFDPHFALPLIGRFFPYEWATELIA